MKCERSELLLEEYFDGELGSHDAALLEAHLAACTECSWLLESLRGEQKYYEGYNRELPLAPGLWHGVSARIAAVEGDEGRFSSIKKIGEQFAALFTTPRLSPAMGVAFVILAVGTTVVVMNRLNREGATRNQTVALRPTEPQTIATGSPPAPAVTEHSPASSEKGANGNSATANDAPPSHVDRRSGGRSRNEKKLRGLAESGRVEAAKLSKAKRGQRDAHGPDKLVREAEAKYLSAIRMLSRDVDGRRPQLDPALAARFDETLAAIDRSIAETRRTVRERGPDPVAVQYMLTAYAKKVEVLREMTQAQ